MRIRTRKFLGTIGLLVLVTAWSLFIMAIAPFMLGSANVAVQTVFYILAGLGWVLPAMPLVSWMLKPDKV